MGAKPELGVKRDIQVLQLLLLGDDLTTKRGSRHRPMLPTAGDVETLRFWKAQTSLATSFPRHAGPARALTETTSSNFTCRFSALFTASGRACTQAHGVVLSANVPMSVSGARQPSASSNG
eukprot:scpid104312/ scgid15104/ 